MSDMGTSDKNYDIVSVMYHAMQGAETTNRYIDDAREHGDREAERFFQEVMQEYKQIAERAKPLLRDRI